VLLLLLHQNVFVELLFQDATVMDHMLLFNATDQQDIVGVLMVMEANLMEPEEDQDKDNHNVELLH